MLVAGYNCEQEMCASCCHGADTGEQKRQTARKYTITNCKKNNERNREAAEIENNGGEGATSARAPGKESWSFPVAAAVNYAIFPLPRTPAPPLTQQHSWFPLLLLIHVGSWSGHVTQIWPIRKLLPILATEMGSEMGT